MTTHLSNTEREIMELFWTSEREFSFPELLDYFSSRQWKKQTLSTYLRKLIAEGFLERRFQGRNAFYTCIVSEEQFKQNNIQEILRRDYGGSISDFMAALVGDNEITQEDKDKLLACINQR